MDTNFKARAEWDRLDSVIVHKPDLEVYFGLLHPGANLYQGPFSRKEATNEAVKFHDVLKEEGVKVYTLEEALLKNLNKTIDKAYEALDYIQLDPDGKPVDQGRLSKKDDYKEILNLRNIDPEDVVRTLILLPTVVLEQSDGVNSKVKIKKYEVEPLTNLVFLRDQQITTDKGIVIGSLSTYQRTEEEAITKLAFDCLKIKPAYEVKSQWDAKKTKNSSALEGGDFIPAGDFALFGNGIRSTRAGIEQVLENAHMNFPEVAVVYDWPSDMDSMHLDTWFNIPANGLYVAREDFVKVAKVDVYERGEQGNYNKANTVALENYLKAKDFNYIGLTKDEQANFGTNFLTLKDGKAVAVDSTLDYAKKLKEIDIILLKLNNFTKMWGGPHCGSCVGRQVA